MLGTEDNDFYVQLEEIIEFTYLHGFSILLFRCKWFDINPSKKRMKVENKIKTIIISSEWFKYDLFILASQAKQVFHIDILLMAEIGKWLSTLTINIYRKFLTMFS